MAGLLIMVYNICRSIAAAKSAKANLDDITVSAPVQHEHREDYSSHPNPWHRSLEGRPLFFTILILVSVIVGGPLEFVPLSLMSGGVKPMPTLKPYTSLELEGRDIYIREGCYNCHSQMIRPFRDEVARYGEVSKAGEFVYDHPFQFGSKRTGPDLHRIGGKYPHFWHYRHMAEPTSTSPNSIMPPYPWLYANNLDLSLIEKKLKAMRTLGVPYSDEEITNAKNSALEQAKEIASTLTKEGATGTPQLEQKEIVALIAYLQRLGTDIKRSGTQEVK